MRLDGTSLSTEALPASFEQDVWLVFDDDARVDAVWVVGFDGAAIKTQAGWCHVLVAPHAR